MSDKLKYRENKRIAAMIACVKDATDDDKPTIGHDRLSELELENAALRKRAESMTLAAYTKSEELRAMTARAEKAEAEMAEFKKQIVISEKYGLSQAAEICRDAALVHPINGYERGYNDACRDNYNAILKVKDKP